MGRPKKIQIPIEEQKDEIIYKLYDFYTDDKGIERAKRSQQCLNLEETALAMSMIDGKKPISKMGVLKIQTKALEKIRKGLEKYGIKSLSDVLDLTKGRKTLSTKFNGIDEE